MILNQSFIELGKGFGDVFELCELIRTNEARLHRSFILVSENNSGRTISLAASFTPANDSKFMPIYICREGIIQNDDKKSQRRLLFENAAEKAGKPPVQIELKHSEAFADRDLFYHYLTGILRLNKLLPPLS